MSGTRKYIKYNVVESRAGNGIVEIINKVDALTIRPSPTGLTRLFAANRGSKSRYKSTGFEKTTSYSEGNIIAIIIVST